MSVLFSQGVPDIPPPELSLRALITLSPILHPVSCVVLLRESIGLPFILPQSVGFVTTLLHSARFHGAFPSFIFPKIMSMPIVIQSLVFLLLN